MRNRFVSPEQADINYRASIAKRICPHCHTGLLHTHPQALELAFTGQVKCVLCGYTRKEPK
jgi:RNase P subunit RPR2